MAAGPFAGILLSAHTVTSGTSLIYADPAGTQPLSPQEVDFTATSDDKDSLRKLDWGVQAGGGVSKPVGGGRLAMDLRAGLGLRNLQKDAADGKNTTGNLVLALAYSWQVRR